MKLYLAGPMSGLPKYNYPEFHRVALYLRRTGFEVLSPAENNFPPDTPWGDYMRDGITKMMQTDGVVVLPDWETSRGASLEVNLALALNLPVAYYWNWTTWRRTPPTNWLITTPVEVPPLRS